MLQLVPTTAPILALKRWSVWRLASTLLLGTAIWLLVALGCLCVGSTGEIGWPVRAILTIRLEVVLLASLIGACLAASGVVYQAILRNPLADPYLLGVSSGASLMGYVWRFPFPTALAGSAIAAASQQAFAFAGALLAVGIVFALASRNGRLQPVTLLLVGVIVNAINGSIFLLLNARFPEVTAGSGGAFSFLVGGIRTDLTARQEHAAAICSALGFIALLSITGKLNVAMLGEAEAEALGIRIQRVRWVGLVIASIVTASAVAISGPIGFIGLICPHLARLVVGGDQRRLLPAATALGAALLAAADAASRLLAGAKYQNTLLPVGVLTSLLGGPFFLILLWQNRRRASGG